MSRVSIQGNEAVSDKKLIKGLHHRKPRGRISKDYAVYNAPALALDRKRIEAYYRARGYYNARVQSSRVVPAKDRVAIVFGVFEGSPTRIIDVRTEGLPPEAGIDAGNYAADAKVVPGRRLVHARYVDLKSSLRRALEKRGYAHAKVRGEIQVHREQRTAIVRLDVDAGPRVKFGKVHVSGNVRVPVEAVKYRVAFDEGETYDPEKLDRTAERVRDLGTFSSVRTELSHDGRSPVADTFIRVSERKRHEIKAGGGVGIDGTRAEVRLRGEYANRMSIHPLVTFRGSVRPGIVVLDRENNDQEGEFVVAARASIQRQDLLLPLLSATIAVDYDIEAFEAYSTRGPSTTWRLARPFFDRKLTSSTAWHFSYLSTIDEEPGVDLGAEEPYRIGYASQTLALDLRDRPVSARYGMFGAVTAEWGDPAMGGTMAYRRLIGELRGYLPAASWLVIAARAKSGVLDVISGDDEPFTRRFFSGGSSSHRGFNFRGLSPESTSGLPIGGNALIETGVEARSRIGTLFGQKLTLGLFLDGGDVTTTYGEQDLMNLHWATGFGFRLDTPLGPLRLDIAYRLNRIEAGAIDFRRAAFHLFSVGEAF